MKSLPSVEGIFVVSDSYKMSFIIRNAQPSDADFIARTVLSGVGYAAFDAQALREPVQLTDSFMPLSSAVDVFKEICAREDTLYSYARTRIACVDGRSAGALISYPGEDNAALRTFTWSLLEDDSSPAASSEASNPVPPSQESRESDTSDDMFADVDAECEAGEYYLDSLAVHPDFRGSLFDYEDTRDKLGHILLLDGIRRGQALGYTRISLIVDVDRPRLHHYYSQLGFRPVRDILFFGHHYTRMVR